MESESFSKLRSKDVVPYQNTSNTYSWPDTDASDSCPDPFGTCFSTSSPHVLPPLDFDDTLSYAPFVTENIVLMRTSDMLRTPTPYNSRNIGTVN